MTHEEFESRMKKIEEKINHDYDYEITHVEADALLIEALDDLGYGAGCKIFENMPKWYA